MHCALIRRSCTACLCRVCCITIGAVGIVDAAKSLCSCSEPLPNYHDQFLVVQARMFCWQIPSSWARSEKATDETSPQDPSECHSACGSDHTVYLHLEVPQAQSLQPIEPRERHSVLSVRGRRSDFWRLRGYLSTIASSVHSSQSDL